MAKFCGKCGAKLDERTGRCPNCDGVPETERKTEPVPPVRSAPVTSPPVGKRPGKFCGRCGSTVDPQTGRCPVCDAVAQHTPSVDVPPAMPSAGKPSRKEKKAAKRAAKKARLAAMSPGRKVFRFIGRLLLWLLLAAVICGLAYFRMIPLKFVDNATEKVESLLGIEPYKGRKVSRETAYDDSGKRLWYHEYAYGADGRLASVTSYDDSGKQTAHIEIPYDELGRELIWWTEDDSGSVYVSAELQYLSATERRVQYTWSDGEYCIQVLDDEENEQEERTYSKDNTLLWTDYYEYDAKGRLTEIHTEFPENSTTWKAPDLTTYEYSGRAKTRNDYYAEYEYDSATNTHVKTGESWLKWQYVSEYNGRGDYIGWTRYERKDKDAPLVKKGSQIRHYALDRTYTGYEEFDGNGNRTMYTTREFLSLWESIKLSHRAAVTDANAAKKTSAGNPQSQEQIITLEQVMDAMKEAGTFYNDWFYEQKYVDETDSFTEGGFLYLAVNYPGITSLDDWKDEARKHYAETVVQELVGMLEWIERQGTLYVSVPSGRGANFLERSYVSLVRSDKTQAEVLVYDKISDYESLDSPYTVMCTRENGYLVLDTASILPWDEPPFAPYEG